MNIFGVVYKITDKLGKCYIGQHLGDGSDIGITYFGSGRYLKRAMKKYGKEYFTYWVFEKCYSQEQLDVMEKYYIKFFQSTAKENGYNLTKGGDGGDTVSLLSDEDKVKRGNKISKSNKIAQNLPNIRKKRSELGFIAQNRPDVRKRNSVSHIGKNNYINKTEEEMAQFKIKCTEIKNNLSEAEKAKNRSLLVESGKYGRHIRWDVKRNIINPDCKFCTESNNENYFN
jgi:hypothetical protein